MNTTQVKDKAQKWEGDAEEAAQNLGSKVQQAAREFQETAQEWQRQLTEATKKASKAADEYVHESPWTVIASVGAACLVIGFLVGRGRD